MIGEACAEVWHADTSKDRAKSFDKKYPACCCEPHSFARVGAKGVAGEEMVARIFTTPESFDLDNRQVIWNKLVRVYSDGLSMFRSGCTETQVRNAVTRLTSGGAEPNSLAGVVILAATDISQAGQPARWFCVYDTEAEEFSVHSDLIGSWTNEDQSKTKQRAERESRLRELRNRFTQTFVPSSTAEELISVLRSRGFAVIAD